MITDPNSSKVLTEETINRHSEAATNHQADTEYEALPRHYRMSFIVFALCCAGPLALPLVWKRPNTSRLWKTMVTVLVLLVTALLCWGLYLAILLLIHSIQECRQLLENL